MMQVCRTKTVIWRRRKWSALALCAALPIFISKPAICGDLKYPDFETQWRNPTAGRGGNPWDPTKSMGLGQQAPLTPEYQAKFEASVREQRKGGQGNSSGASCVLPGMPKVMNFSEPMEIIIRPAITYFVPMQYPTRRIYTDGRDWPADEPPTLGGYSIGRWINEDGDGRYDALEVETRNFTGPRVFWRDDAALRWLASSRATYERKQRYETGQSWITRPPCPCDRPGLHGNVGILRLLVRSSEPFRSRSGSRHWMHVLGYVGHVRPVYE